MKLKTPRHPRPRDADACRAVPPVICYPPDTLPALRRSV